MQKTPTDLLRESLEKSKRAQLGHLVSGPSKCPGLSLATMRSALGMTRNTLFLF